ncbi:hypothetical protein [Leptolyngbya sp. PL-A3]|uniref:hypothetical protein n=1 Tax=Leptolyngbya sp. PL-A3 TaxID=2933911 RepID=UPI003296E404
MDSVYRAGALVLSSLYAAEQRLRVPAQVTDTREFTYKFEEEVYFASSSSKHQKR